MPWSGRLNDGARHQDPAGRRRREQVRARASREFLPSPRDDGVRRRQRPLLRRLGRGQLRSLRRPLLPAPRDRRDLRGRGLRDRARPSRCSRTATGRWSHRSWARPASSTRSRASRSSSSSCRSRARPVDSRDPADRVHAADHLPQHARRACERSRRRQGRRPRHGDVRPPAPAGASSCHSRRRRSSPACGSPSSRRWRSPRSRSWPGQAGSGSRSTRSRTSRPTSSWSGC